MQLTDLVRTVCIGADTDHPVTQISDRAREPALNGHSTGTQRALMVSVGISRDVAEAKCIAAETGGLCSYCKAELTEMSRKNVS